MQQAGTSKASLELRAWEYRAVWRLSRIMKYGKDPWQSTHPVRRAVLTCDLAIFIVKIANLVMLLCMYSGEAPELVEIKYV